MSGWLLSIFSDLNKSGETTIITFSTHSNVTPKSLTVVPLTLYYRHPLVKRKSLSYLCKPASHRTESLEWSSVRIVGQSKTESRKLVRNTGEPIKESIFGSEDNTTIHRKVNMFDAIKYYKHRKSFLKSIVRPFLTDKSECNVPLIFMFLDQNLELVNPIVLELNKAYNFYLCFNNQLFLHFTARLNVQTLESGFKHKFPN